MTRLIPLVMCAASICGCPTLADAHARPAPQAQSGILEQYWSWKQHAVLARGCTQSERAFESEHGRKISSINQSFLIKYPNSRAVRENPILVLGVACEQDVNGRPTRVIENRFSVATDHLIRSIEQAGAS